MNFLGHCYLTRKYPHLMAGNLGGDFFKGNPDNFSALPSAIIQGIKVHRFIDSFTDSSEEIRQVAHLFQEHGVQKVSGIACDLLVDHHLSREWKTYSEIPYRDFIQRIYSDVEMWSKSMPKEFNWFYDRLKSHEWMLDYPQIEGITKITRQFSHRIRFNNNLPLACTLYTTHQKTIDKHFQAFLAEISPACERFILEHEFNIS